MQDIEDVLSAHVLLNLLNELGGKGIKCEASYNLGYVQNQF